MKFIPSLILSFTLFNFWSCSDSGNPVNHSGSVVDNCGIADGDNSSCVNYSTEIQPIFDSKCTGCHGTYGGLSLASWDDLMSGDSNNGPLVISGDTLNSKLIEKLRPNPTFGNGRMPQNDQNYFTDNPSKLELIKIWILEGAKNN